jgi:hypothetical protein
MLGRDYFAIALGFVLILGSDVHGQSAPVRPRPPAIKNRDWIQIPFDTFVLHGWESTGKEAPAEADRTALLQKLTLGIAGRPATGAEIDKFMKARTKRAYEKEVDRLLDLPGFEERFAAMAQKIRKDDPRSAREVAAACWRRLNGRSLENAAALEWLACELIDPTLVNCCELDRPLPDSWEVKHLVRAIVVSATYRCEP